jgi:hypothetical protein
MDVPPFLDYSLPWHLDERVRAELHDGERLLWVGQPRARWFSPEAGTAVIFGSVFTAFALFWTYMAAWIVWSGEPGKNDPGIAVRVCFPSFGLFFVLIGLGLLSTPFWLRRKAKQTCYALTDRRAILFEGGSLGGFSVRSYGPHDLKALERVEYPDGSGDLVFAGSRRGRRRVRTDSPGFMRIDNVREVEALLRQTLHLGDAR